MNRAATRSLIMKSQAAALVLALGGAAIALSPSPFSGVTKAEFRPPAAANAAPKRSASTVDTSLASSLVAISLEQQREPPPAPPPPPGGDAKKPEVQTPAEVVWEYIGGLIGPSSRRAIVSVGGDQRMVKEAETIDGVRVNAITADFITIEREGKENRIERKKKERIVAAAGPLPASGMAPAARGPQGTKLVPDGPSKGSNLAGKAAKAAELRDRQRRLYMDALRASDFNQPTPEMLQKFGIGDFKPDDSEMENIMRQLKQELNGETPTGEGEHKEHD